MLPDGTKTNDDELPDEKPDVIRGSFLAKKTVRGATAREGASRASEKIN
jgi:hypothetical protein